MKKYVLAFASLILALMVSAQAPDPVKWKVNAGPQTGCEVTLTFTAEVDPGWHLYAVEHSVGLPLAFEYVQSSQYSFVGALLAPVPFKEYDNIFESDIFYYKESTVQFSQRIKITAGHEPFKVEGVITGQVCKDDGLCIRIEFPFELGITPSGHCH